MTTERCPMCGSYYKPSRRLVQLPYDPEHDAHLLWDPCEDAWHDMTQTGERQRFVVRPKDWKS
jgi:hypothetical protein